MDTNQERFGDLLNTSSTSGSGPATAQPGDRFGDLLAAKPQPQRQTQERDYQAPGGNFDDLIAQEGADAIKPIIQAIYAQESGSGKNARTSIDGARGGMQVIPATFARFARPGEDINNPDDAVRVGIRYAKYLGDKFGNDPAKIAAGYFSGEGNVNSGQGIAWKNDRADGNGKSVSGYVSDVMKRIGQMPAGDKKDASAPLPDLNNIPKWGEIAGSARFKGLDSAKQAEVKGQYFDEVIAPHAKASGANVDQVRQQFMAQPNAKPGMLDQAWEATKDIAGRLATNPFAKEASVLDGVQKPDPNDPNAVSLPGSVMDGYVPQQNGQSLGGRSFADASKQVRQEQANADALIQRGPLPELKASPLNNGPMDIAKGLAYGMRDDIGQAGGTLARGVGNFLATESIGNPELQAAGKTLEQSGANLYRKYKKSEQLNQPEFETDTAKGIYGGARSLEQMLSALLVGGPEGALPVMVGQVGIQGAGDALEKGKDYFTAGAYGAGQGALEYVTEKLPMGFIAERLGKEGFKKFVSGFLARELPSEQIATLTQDALQKAVLEPEKTWTQYLEERPGAAYQTALGTAVIGGGMAGLNKGLQSGGDMIANRRADQARQSALDAWNTRGFSQPARQQQSANVTPDGRIEPSLNGAEPIAPAEPAGAPAVHPLVETADNIVREAAQVAGIPADAVMPQQTDGGFSDDDVIGFAQSRIQELTQKRDGTVVPIVGETGIVNQDMPGVGLTPDEQRELDILQRAGTNPQALRSFYKFDQSQIQSDQSQFATQANQPAPAAGVAEQPAVGQQFPAATEPGLVAAQENQNVQVQGQDQANGPAPSTGAVRTDGIASGAAAQQEPAAQAAAAQADGSNGGRVAGQQDGTVQPQGALLTDEQAQAINGWLDAIGETDPAVRQQVMQQAATNPQARDQFLSQAEAAAERQAIQSEQAAPVEQPAIPQPEEAAGSSVNPFEPAKQPAKTSTPAFTRKEIPAMTNEELVEAQKYYSDRGHKRAAKIEKEINKRAKEMSNGTQAQEAKPAEAGQQAQPVQPADVKPNLADEPRQDQSTQVADESTPFTKESSPVLDDTDAELNDALAHLGEVLSDVFQPKAGIVANKYGAGDLLPALSKVVELLVRKGFKSFAEATAKAAGAMRGNEKTAPFVNSISARQWKAAYNAVAEFHEGTDDEAAVSAISNDDVLAIVRGKPATEKAASAKPDLFTPEGKFAIAKEVADFFIGGGEFKSIVDARKKISDLTGHQINAGTEAAKQADEAIETAVVLAGREMVQSGRKQGRSSAVIFDRLLSLYNAQPNLAVRSSTSMRDQAYSTPVPLAYVASELAGITYETKVLEPTAGNGMLLVGAATGKATANELNPKRAAMLDAIGFKAKTDNAATGTLAQAKSQDAVIANPPFGVTKDENGNTIIYDVTPTYGTREVDHAIVFKSLETMKDDGRAVLIVGGVQAEGDEARREDYRGKSKRTFYFNLYDKYNVVDHFSINGDMYSKQGASYPVDVIVIHGRGKSARDLPAADLPKVINSYDELKEKLNEAGRVGTAGNVGTNGTAGSESASRAGDGADVAGSTGQPSDGNGVEGKRQGVSGRDVQRDGSADGKQSAPGRASDATGQLGSSDAAQLRSDRSEPVSGDSNGKRPGRRGSDQRNGSVDVGGSGGIDGQRVESGLADRRGQEQETETQVAYTPHSQAASVGTLVPRAMKDSIQESIKKIEDQFGNVDEFVADALKLDPESLRSNFSAEQVDALALAIKNAQEGRGFIIGDQTGIGKGRVVAAMIKYALVNGKVPIFVTEKPNLYSDMIRDLDDIGMAEELGLDTKKSKILITNRDESIPYSIIRTNGDEVTETNFTLKAPKSSKDALEKLFSGMRESNSLGDYKVIFTTYSQLQTVKGKKTERMNFIEHFGAGNYMIFDESHNAGGAGETQARTREQRQAAKNGESLVTGRAAFVRGLVNKAFGTFFSSATYAKRPDVMDLYSSTNMKLAVDKISELGEAIKQGGVPMQQIVATMLTKDGQYIRRERTFAGVSYDTTETKVDKKTAENMASAMRSILRFSRAKEAAIKAIQKEMDKQGGMVSGVGGEKTSVQGANFGSSMHNLIDQMLLSLKSKSSVDHAIDRLKAGEKVVMTVSNTMGSFLKDYADEMELASGDVVSMSFADLYKRYLEKQRIVTIKRPNGQTEKYRLTDEDLGSSLSQMFREIGKQIDSAGFGEATISPIDYMHAKLREAGYKSDEITGRTLVLNYDNGEPKLAGRKADIKQRVNAVRGFNNGDTDVLILNQAGSTGLSLHASSKFKDQRKRHMIIVQAEKNIDTHMQMLGRVHRTGQIVAPAYSQMMADIPAEMRPAAVLLKKMASLNANTTASRKSSVTAEGVVDFMNDYGGQVVQEYLRDNREVHSAIGGQGVIKLTDDSSEASEDDIRKFTGYIPILPIKQQEEIYKDLIDRYNELLERENSLGTNKLEAKAVDLDADTVSSQPITEDKGDPSIFATPAFMERVDVKRTVKPYSSAEVADMVAKRLDGKRDMVVALEMSKDMSARTDAYIKATVEKMEASDKADPVKINEFKTQTESTARHVDTVLKTYPIGTRISVTDRDGATLYGIVTDVVNSGRTANPSAPSSWKMHVALANGDAKAITLSFSQVGGRYTLAVERNVNWYNAETQQSEFVPVQSLFDKGATVRREKRWIVTGNILAGYAKHPGQIITYTKKDGGTGQGVLMSRQFDYAQAKASERVRIKTGDDAVRFLDGSNGAMVGTDDNVLKISKRGHLYMVSVPSSKKEGGTYFLDQQLTEAMGGDFYKRGSVMSATLYYSTNVRDLVDYLVRQREEKVVALTNLDKAREMFNPAGRGFENISRTQSPAPAFTNAKMNRQIDKLNKAVEEGRMTDAEFRLAVKEMRQKLKEVNDDKKVDSYSKERRNGADWIIAKLRRGVADGKIPRGEADFAEWALNQNPRIADRLTISVTEADGKSARGEYFPYLQMIKLYASNLSEDQGDHGTAVHEILHHAERMMPVDVQAGILDEWQRQWDAEYKKSSPEVKAAMRDMLAASFGNAEAKDRVVKAFNNGLLNYDQHYQFYSPSEFWTVNATAILNNRFEARGSWVKRVQQWFREFIERLKGLVGAQSDTPVLNALRDLMETDGNPKSSKMIQERDYSMWLNEKDVDAENDGAEISHQDIVRNMRNKAIQFFGNQDLNTFNWYDKSIATQYHKALKDKHFGKVYSLLLDMQNHVSLAANRAAERAPGVLPMVDDLKAAVKGLVSKQNQAAMDKASQMLFAGTLAGSNVLEGKVWTNAEMRNKFGADDAAIEFYRQSREAIDSMLDEMAATEAFVLAKPMISGNKEIRGSIIENPKDASGLIEGELAKKIKMFAAAAKQARGRGDEAMAESMDNAAKEHNDALRKVKKIFKHATDLKMAGYMPLKRFGKYDVTAKLVDPITGQTMRNEDGEPSTLFYGRFDTQAEARKAEAALRERYAGQDDVSIKIGAHNSERNELYSGVDLDALQLFADAFGEKRVTDEYIRTVRSERSVLKHLLERKETPGFSTDIQRVLAAYLTAGARHAAQQLYSIDVAYAIKHIPSEKGDVQREAQSLRDFVMNQKDPGAVLSSVMFLWFLSGSPAAAAINLTQPILISMPVLSIQAGGEGKAIAALAKAYKLALGKAELTKELRDALHKASLGGIVDAQEIFHLYSQASRQVGGTTKAQSAMAILSFMFSAAEKLNRRVTFIAAYNIAKQTGHADPYGYAVGAVNSTQGIYNKVNRPNAARSPLGRAVFTYKTFAIMVGELMWRLAKKHGPAGKRALGVMLAMLFLAAGEEGLPGAKLLDDLIDTIGQLLGYDTNAKRFKRRHAYEILGRFWGDFAMYGVSSMLPLDFGGRLGMGSMIPGTEILKPSSGMFNTRSLAEIAGPTVGAAKQVGDFSEAAAEGNYGKALANLSPKFIRDILGGFEMAAKGHATNTLGQKTVNTTGLDAAVKAIGFNPTVVASDSREKMPIRQDERLRSAKAASFAGQLSQAMIDRDGEAARKIGEKLKAWNEKNPDTRINVADVARSARERTKKAMMDSDQRTMKTAPKSMRGRVSSDLGL